MEIKTRYKIWNESNIETTDYWGRQGSGIPLIYFNPKINKDEKFISCDSLLHYLKETLNDLTYAAHERKEEDYAYMNCLQNLIDNIEEQIKP